MLTNNEAARQLKRKWGVQVIRRRHDPRWIQARKRFAALCIHDYANLELPYAELDQLVVALVWEDECHHADARGRASLRFCGYRASRIPYGVQWGGAINAAFFKDLALAPRYGGRGQCIDLQKTKFLSLALQMDQLLINAVRRPLRARSALQLPRLWAGFRPKYIGALLGEGPEIEHACQFLGITPKVLLRRCQRRFEGLRLLPVDFLGAELECATAVFAELRDFPRRQVFHVPRIPDSLIGFSGATAFDFYHSRFRPLLSTDAGNKKAMLKPAV